MIDDNKSASDGADPSADISHTAPSKLLASDANSQLPSSTSSSSSLPTPSTSPSPAAASCITLTIHMSGGLELLFDRQKKQLISLPLHASSSSASSAPNIRILLQYLLQHKLRERAELFMLDGTVRPGILVLINDCDWELLGGLDAPLEQKDDVTFISTLHGG